MSELRYLCVNPNCRKEFKESGCRCENCDQFYCSDKCKLDDNKEHKLRCITNESDLNKKLDACREFLSRNEKHIISVYCNMITSYEVNNVIPGGCLLLEFPASIFKISQCEINYGAAKLYVEPEIDELYSKLDKSLDSRALVGFVVKSRTLEVIPIVIKTNDYVACLGLAK
jgi:hypothetical protein